MEKENLIKCDACESYKGVYNFYKIITERKNLETGEYEQYSVCKNCIETEYLNYIKDYKYSGADASAIKYICEKYNIYYDLNIVNSICKENCNDKYKLGKYFKEINSLKQYKDKKYKDSILTRRELKQKKVEDWNDLEFLNIDIKNIKINMLNSIDKEDFNAHNKWMNSLRDALELREKLLSKENKISIDNLNDLKVDYGVFEGKDTNGETVGIVPIFINSHYVRSAYVKYVDGKYEMTDYATNTNKQG